MTDQDKRRFEQLIDRLAEKLGEALKEALKSEELEPLRVMGGDFREIEAAEINLSDFFETGERLVAAQVTTAQALAAATGELQAAVTELGNINDALRGIDEILAAWPR